MAIQDRIKDMEKKPEVWINQEELLKFIDDLEHYWHFADVGYFHFYKRRGYWYLNLHTGGWKDNEEIICALRNSTFWSLYWQKSERGGHYYFSGKISNGGGV